MPDITMCSGERRGDICPTRETCYRYKAKPNLHWQSYFWDAPEFSNGCEMHIPYETEDVYTKAILLCKGIDDEDLVCPKRLKCYRFLESADDNREYFDILPYDRKKRKCSYFIDYKKK